ncbi:NAD(P)/FAD-dependent oxidoreductase [bacterium]|nr:NAD(P)/FAD-dependent oxidoreductase [bacterium]
MHHQIVIIGGGTGGLMVAAQLLNRDRKLDVAIIEPSENHYYQPAWTLVGAGTFDYDKTRRDEADYIPSGAKWIKDWVEDINADDNELKLRSGQVVSYDYLVASPGIQIDLDAMPGLKEAMGKNGVCSNYVDPNYTWEVLKNFKGGNALFTQPTTPIKCGGAPQKIAYLAADYFKRNKVNAHVIFATPGSTIFGVKDFADTLMQVIYRYGMHLKTFYAPVAIEPDKKLIHFRWAKPGDNNCIVTEQDVIHEEKEGDLEIKMPYDMLHIAPPQSAPDFVKRSKLAITEGPNKGWIDVDINTLQHNRYKNVFALGDSAALPTAKTGAAIRKQAPVVAENLLHTIKSNNLSDKKYYGYSSCPLVTGYGKMVLAEFKYDNIRDSDPFLSKFVNTAKENWSMWILKKYGLPYLYWNKMLRGKM